MADTGGTTGDLDALRSGCEESREVLDHLNTTLDDIADKGVWTARTAVFVLGVVVSGISIGRPLNPASTPATILALGGLGIALLFSSMFVGLGLYLRTENVLGPGAQDRARLARGSVSEADWRVALLAAYTRWIRAMDKQTDIAGRRLYVAWGVLTGGLVLLTVAAVLSILA